MRRPLRTDSSRIPTLSERALNVLDNLKSVVFVGPTFPDPPFWSKTSFIQFGYGVWVSLGPSVVGMAFGYSAVAVPMLKLDKEVNMSEIHLSWFASILTLSSPVGCVLSGYLADRLGRRIALIIAELPMALGWLYIALAMSPVDMIIGRALTGVALGMIMTPSRVYTSEIALPNMRGTIGTFLNLAIAIGITIQVRVAFGSCLANVINVVSLTIQAVLGMYLHWRVLSYISFSVSSCLFLLNMLLPETPYFVLMSDTEDKARKTLAKFRSSKHNTDAEMRDMINFKNVNNIRKLTLNEKMKVLITPASCKPFWTINLFCVIVQLAGVTVLVFWTVTILEHAKSSVEPKFGNSLVAGGRIVGSAISSILTYSWRRRTLSFLSGFGVAIGFICLAINTMVADKPSMVPQICIMMCVISACIGFYSMPMLMMSELYPLQVRGILGGLTVSWANIIVFLANMSFMPMKENFGFKWTMLQYGVWAIIGTIALYYILPETKDLTLQEIEEYYNKRRPSLLTQRQLESEILLARQSAASGLLYGRKSQAALSKQSTLDVMKSTTVMDVTIPNRFNTIKISERNLN